MSGLPNKQCEGITKGVDVLENVLKGPIFVGNIKVKIKFKKGDQLIGEFLIRQ